MALATIIVEDGTGVDGANSYASLQQIRDFALNRGVTLSAEDATLIPMVFKAMDYIEFQKFKGEQVATDQALSWPRNCVWIGGNWFANDDIPRQLVNALCQAVMEVNTDLDLMPTQDGTAFVTQEIVGKGDVSTSYSDKYDSGGQPTMPKVNGYLSTLVETVGGLRVVHA